MIWDGIARNPLAAAEFYDENFDLMQKKGAYDFFKANLKR